MVEVTGYTAAKMEAELDEVITGATVNGSGDLILTKRGGGSVNAGHVVGPTGEDGVTNLPVASTVGTSNLYQGYWSKLIDIRLANQYNGVSLSLHMISYGTGSSASNRALIDIRFKQQNVMTSQPVGKIIVTEMDQFGADVQVKGLVVQNSAIESILRVYVKNNLSYDRIVLRELGKEFDQGSQESVTYYTNSAWEASLPGGYQVINGSRPVFETPAGVITPFGGSSAPSGWLLCDGSSFSSDSYPDLAAVLGDTYGVHSGTTYYLPNLKGRIPVGRDSGQTEFDVLGELGGAKTHTLTEAEMPSHTHTQNSHNHTQNSHNHTQNSHSHGIGGADNFTPTFPVADVSEVRLSAQQAYPGTGSSFKYMGTTDVTPTSVTNGVRTTDTDSATATNVATTATNVATTATNQDTGGDGAHNNLQPYITLNYIIKT